MLRARFLAIFFSLIFIVSVSPALAKDEWIQVRSKNFFLVGNASEKDIRLVCTRLEQFRETFRQLFGGANLKSSVPTNVVVFKNESAYTQFKPKRADGKIDKFVAGFFQPGPDVNYITLSMEGEDEQTFSVIFHEFVHSIVNTNFGKSEVPAWFNEGLAEYYSTFAIEADQKAKLGLPLDRHLNLLLQNKLMPLESLLSVSNSQLLNTGDHSRSIFYAESWVLVHYLLRTGKTESLAKFLDLMVKDTPQETAFQTAFQTTYAAMEKDLRKYVEGNKYMYQQITFKEKLTFDSGMTVSPLSPALMNTYLGDLLAHTRRDDDAEPFLKTALQLDPGSSMANTTLGMVKLRQRKFEEAKQYLEVALKDDGPGANAYYNYAYLLSRDGRDEFGFQREFSKETAEKMRVALRKAIALDPAFTPSYDLLAYVNVTTNEQLDEAAAIMKKALAMQPGNQTYVLRLADIYMRQEKYADAKLIIEKIARTTDDPELKNRAEQMATYLRQREDFDKQQAEMRRDYGVKPSDGRPMLKRSDKPMSEAEIAKANAESTLRAVNESVRKLNPGETRVIGHVQKIDCKTKPISFLVKTPDGTFTVVSKDFQALDFNVFIPEADNVAVGCDANISAFNAVVTYKPAAAAKGTAKGDLLAIEFVADDFRIMSEAEMNQPSPRVVPQNRLDDKGAALDPQPSEQDLDKGRLDGMMQAMRSQLRQPAEGEKREFGFLEKMECSGKGVFMIFRTTTGTLRFSSPAQQQPAIRVFTPDLRGMQIGCTMKPIEYPVVFVYKDLPDAKAKTNGSIVALDFMPKSFTLDE